MSALVLPFPSRYASSKPNSTPPASGVAVIPFPKPTQGLTDADVAALSALVPALQGWACEIEPDPTGNRWAALMTHAGHDRESDALIVYRNDGLLVLLDAGGRMLGHFSAIEELLGALLNCLIPADLCLPSRHAQQRIAEPDNKSFPVSRLLLPRGRRQ